MKWFKKPQDLYDLLLLENLWFGNAGSFARRVPGGWIFYGSNVPPGMTGGTMVSTFVPYSEEFLNLNNENIENLADHDQNVDLEEHPEKKDSDPGQVGHRPGPG